VSPCPALAASVSVWSSYGQEWTERSRFDASCATLLLGFCKEDRAVMLRGAEYLEAFAAPFLARYLPLGDEMSEGTIVVS
jgi:hypothetical protein